MNQVRVVLVLLCAGMAVPVTPGQSKIVPDHDPLQAQVTASSESTLYFPDYVDGGGWSIQLALSNLDPSRNASVGVTAYDPQGREVSGLFDSGNRFEIPARGSRILRSAGRGNAARRGWIEVKSETAAVRGLLTYRQAGTGIEVGVEPVRLRDHFALFVVESSDIGTGLAIFKPEPSPEIEFRIRDEAGMDPLGEALTRGDFRQRARTLAEWLQGTDPEILRDFRGILFLRTAVGSTFAPLGLRFGKRQDSLSAVPVIPIMRGTEGRNSPHSSPAAGSLYFPDYVEGEGWSVQMVLGNLDPDRSAPVVVEVYDSQGQPVSKFFDSENSFEIPAFGSRLLRSGGAGAIRRGWIEVKADPVSVTGLLTYRNVLTGIEVGVDPVGLGESFALFVEESSDIGTGLAIMKPDSSSEIELRLRDEEGRDPLGRVVIPREDFHQRARTIPEWFDVEGVDQGSLRDFRGLLFLRAADGSSFSPVGLRFGKQQGSLSAVPVISLDIGLEPGLTKGLPEHPFVDMTIGGTQGSTRTVGTLRLGLNPDAFPVIVRESETWADVLVSGSRLGEGRVVAFSGQDFLSSGDRATLLGTTSGDRLLANAVRWSGRQAHSASLRVLADNQRIADALERQGLGGVEVVGRGPDYWERDWSASALDDADVAVVQANEWGTAHLVEESVAPLRTFVERGGGLVIAGSALHWDWWIRKHHGPFTGDLLLRGTGISWNKDSIDEIESASTDVDLSLTPAAVWGAYIAGDRLDASRMALLPVLFNSALELGRTKELDVALVRLVRETPALPTPSAAPLARLSAEVAETLGPHEWPETHPWAAVFPGLPADGASRAEGTVTVDASRSEFPADASRRERHLPLGLYAPPSALVTIEVPASHATGELRVAVGQRYDDLGEGYASQPIWRRPPWLRREFSVADRQTGVTNAYGGSIALVVPADYAGTVPVTVRGAIPMAVYTAGESNAADWFAALDAGAPQAIIQKLGGIRFVLSAERAHGITDPGEVSAFWDGFLRHHADLSGEPVPRAFESIWIFDPQVGWGYANAGWIRINYPLHGEHWVLVPGTVEGRTYLASLRGQEPSRHVVPPPDYSPWRDGVDWWLFGHELGHQWQTKDWTGHGITEVGVNLFTMYTLNYYVYGGDDFNIYAERKTHGCAAPLDHAALASRRWPTEGPCERLALYRQLIAEFGWAPMKTVFHSYYDPAYPRSTYGGSLDGFAIRFSAIVKRDLVAFFRHWEYPLSEAAAATIRGFGLKEWLPPGW